MLKIYFAFYCFIYLFSVEKIQYDYTQNIVYVYSLLPSFEPPIPCKMCKCISNKRNQIYLLLPTETKLRIRFYDFFIVRGLTCLRLRAIHFNLPSNGGKV